MNRIKKPLQVLLAFMLVACGQSSELSWTEDVKLPDGQVVTLSRWVEFKGPHAMGDTATESKQRLEFKHPETGEKIKWENVKEQGTVKTVAIWMDKGRPMLLSTPAYGDDAFKFNCPNPPYLLHEYVAGQWQPRSLAQIPIKIIRANLTTHAKDTDKRNQIEANKRHLTAAQTSDSYTYRDGVHKVPYVMKFEGVPTQTFGNQNCDHDFNELLLTEGK